MRGDAIVSSLIVLMALALGCGETSGDAGERSESDGGRDGLGAGTGAAPGGGWRLGVAMPCGI